MIRPLSLFLFLSLSLTTSSAQPLPDGVYQRHASVLVLTPDYPWSVIEGEMVRLEGKRSLKVENFVNTRNRTAPLPYAVVMDGRTYLHIPAKQPRNYEEFAGLSETATLSRVSYDTTIHTRQLMRAFNPANGRPFREAYVERDKVVHLDRVVDLRTGRLYPFDLETVRRLCADDRDLRAALARAQPGETEKLERALRIYSQRNPLEPSPNEPNR